MNNNNYTRIYDSSGLQDLLSQALIDSTATAPVADNALVRWDGILGQNIQSTDIILDDNENLTMPTGSDITFNGTGGIVFTEVGGTDTITLRAPNSITNAYNLILPANTGTDGYFLGIESIGSNNVQLEWRQSLNVPGVTTLNAIVRWDGTTGSSVQNSGITINSDNTMTVATGGITFNGTGYVYFAIPGSTTATGVIAPPGTFPSTNITYYLPDNDAPRPEDILAIKDISGGNVTLDWVQGTTGPAGVLGEPLFKMQDTTVYNIYGATGSTMSGLLTSGTGGFYNFCAGDQVFPSLARGSKNIGIGNNIGNVATHATGCIFLGNDHAPLADSLGVKNIVFGNSCMSLSACNTGASKNIMIGNNVFCRLTGTALGNIGIGNDVGEYNFGNYNMLFGTRAGYATTFTGDDNIGLGRDVYNSTGCILNGTGNIAVGVQAAQTLGGHSVYNICIGNNAGSGTGVSREYHNCIYMGEWAGRDCTGGAQYNIGIGYHALGGTGTNFSASDQIAIGSYALYNVTNPSASNIGIGYCAGYSLTSGIDNIAIGQRAMAGATEVETTGNSRNIAIGTRALAVADATPGSTNENLGNIAIGYGAGSSLTTGRMNVLIGKDAGATLTSGTGCICIGYGADVDSGAAVNRTAIGTQATGPNADGGCFIRHRSLAASGNQARWSGNELFEDSSSIRFKTDVRDYVDGQDERFDKIETFWYRPKEGYGLIPNDKTRFAGFIAEQLHELYPEFVVYEDKAKTIPKGVDYAHLVVLLVEKIKKLRTLEREQEELLASYMKEVEHLLYLADVKNGRIA